MVKKALLKISKNIRHYNHNKDYRSLQSFAEVVWPGMRLMIDPQRLIWQYVENPHRPKSDCSALYIFVDDGAVLGTLGTMPVEFYIGKQKVYARWLTDYYVLPSFQGKGIGGSLLRQCMTEYPLIMVAGTGPKSYPLFKRAGFNEVKGYCNVCHYSLPSLSQIIRKPKEVIRNVLRLYKTIDLLYVTREPKANLYFKKTDCFTTEMAELTEDILSESGRMIFVKRTVAYMNWKYTTIEGIREYEIFEIVDSENSVGWMVLSSNYKKLRGIIVELCLQNENMQQYCEASLHYAIQYFRKKGMNVILSLADKALEKEYNKAGYQTAGSFTKFLYYTIDKHLKEEIEKQENKSEQPWFLSYGDSDLALYS